ncbi:MAG: hypothetical protein V2A62_05020 [Candidatus Woesearchaeota archaeon]
MKKVVLSLMVLSVFLLLVGCLNYKAYEIPVENKSPGNDLVKSEVAEIKPVEEKITIPTEVEGEVVLPALGENKTASVEEATAENLEVLNAKENQLVKLKLSAIDPNKDKVTYTFSKPFDTQGAWKTNYGDAGEYIITVSASDGKLTTEKKIKLVIQKVNVAPAIAELKDINVNEGDLVKLDPKVTDPNHDPITITISDPLSKGIWQTTPKDSGVYNLKVTASDGELQVEKSLKLTVKNVNLLPVITNLADVNASEGQTIRLVPVVTDEDKDEGENITVTFSKPFDQTGVWTPDYTNHGVYLVNVTANDGRGAVVTKQVTVTVGAVNMPPVIEKVTLETK